MGLSFLRAVAKQRKRKRRKMQTLVAPEIPVDLLMEILARLPAKSVIRFKCISKVWSSLLSSRYFCHRFLMVQSTPQPRLYMSLLDFNNDFKSVLLSSSPSTLPSSFVFDQDLTVRGLGGYYLRAVRGFISLTIHKRAVIYNPCTKQLVILPAITQSSIRHDNISYFLCYDSANDQYKLLCTIAVVITEGSMERMTSELWVYVLETGGFWKRVAKDFPHHLPNPLELSMNGVLYYLAWTDSHTCVLVSFDIRSEEFNMMQLPRKAGDVAPRLEKWMSQVEYHGKVVVFDFFSLKQTGTIDLWTAEDWSNKEWSMKTLVFQPSQMDLVIDNYLKPKGTILKGKIILVPRKLKSPFYFLCYDLETNDLKKVEIKGIPSRWFRKNPTTMYFDVEFMDLSENIKYLETCKAYILISLYV